MTGERLELARMTSAVWWAEFPLFAALIGRVTFERGCMDPSEALALLMRTQRYAVTVAVIYIAGYAWLVGAMLLRARARTSTGAWPPLSNGQRWQFGLFALAIALDQSPHAIWAWVSSLAGVCR